MPATPKNHLGDIDVLMLGGWSMTHKQVAIVTKLAEDGTLVRGRYKNWQHFCLVHCLSLDGTPNLDGLVLTKDMITVIEESLMPR